MISWSQHTVQPIQAVSKGPRCARPVPHPKRPPVDMEATQCSECRLQFIGGGSRRREG